MHIKSIVIDGFKSYGKRVDVKDFDKEFNSITGLNGSGKSNILDAICFVLGISNLVQVRATNLQELVYKNGQAGVTKATVTLTFCNKDRENSPQGYDRFDEISITRQVVVGGKNKYFINGKSQLNKQVQDLFCSVKMNVNNPNFLIMQGHITKTLNKKPLEILSMIEEAAGTSMYQNKREKSLILMDRKKTKLDGLNALVKDDIEPKLKKLRLESDKYKEYQNVVQQIDYLTRLYYSYEYLGYQESLKSIESEIAKLTEAIQAYNETTKSNETEVLELDEKIREIQENMDTHAGGELKELEKQNEAANKQDANLKAKSASMKDTIETDQRKLMALAKSIKSDEADLAKQEGQMQKMNGLFETLKTAETTDQNAFLDAQKKFEAVSSGLSINDEGEASSLQDQLMNAKSKVSEAISNIKQSEMELKHSTASQSTKQRDLKHNDTAYEKDKAIIEKTEREIKALEQQMSRIAYQDGQLEQMQERHRVLTTEIRNMRNDVNRKFDHFEFKYSDPTPNFDRKKVKGMIANLVTIKDNKYSQALSTCIGGGWRNVVTDNEITGKLLLQKGNLQSRTTIVPLNKVSYATLDPSKVKNAQNLVGKENVNAAISLITYDPEMEPAVKSCFGTTLICKDLATARRVAFSSNISLRCITLDGDVVDPQGTLSGGSVSKDVPILDGAGQHNKIKKDMNVKQHELNQLSNQIQTISAIADQFKRAKEQLELLQLQLNTVQQRLQTTTFQQNQDEINELAAKIESLKQTIVESRQIQKTNQEKIKSIEAKLGDAKGYRDRELKEAQDNMKKMKQKSDASTKNWKKHEQEYETLKLEIEDLKNSIDQAKEQMAAMEEAMEAAKAKYDEMNDQNKDVRQAHDELKAKIKDQKDKISSHNKEIKTKSARKDKCLKQNQDLLLEIKKKENEINKIKVDTSNSRNRLKTLEDKYPWILEDRDFFGARNTRYDYNKSDPKKAGPELKKLSEIKDKLSRNINQNAMALLDKEEERFTSLTKKIDQVIQDKQKINNIIIDLDASKKKSLKDAWEEVNANFSSIFKIVLPGTDAKLVPSNDGDFMKGLEFKVAFNGVWKESLTELSGGQRSLVALSFILAMLKFNPSPLYILDEVDAALDLSHTQNIGNMLKRHFKSSQFIVVSLKDLMFQHANVVYTTKFVDGMSTVTRRDNKKKE